jgi:hypothetical protein
MKKGQIVRVVWHDAEVTAEWTEEDNLQDHSSTLCETVGFLVTAATKKNPMYIIAATRSEGEKKKMEYNAIQKIPKVWVKEITPL